MSSIDLRAAATYPVRLGASVLHSAESKKYTTVRYNHSIRARNPKDVRSTLNNADSTQEELVVRDGEDEYQYQGRSTSSENWFVLVRKGSGKDSETTLERLGARHDFNLTATPLEKDTKLAAQFQQLPIGNSEGLVGNENSDMEPIDPDNPWDYRHYMKPAITKTRDRAASIQQSALDRASAPSRTSNSTPVSRATKQTHTPSTVTPEKKRKAFGAIKSDSKRVKAGTEPARPSAVSTAKQRQDVPIVRIDRKASVRRPSIDDSGELILENETPASEKPPKKGGAMALALSGQFGQGPISLRSAASSPASMVASPLPNRPEGIADGEEFEIGGNDSSPEAADKQPPRRHEDDCFGSIDDEDDADADADIEDLELPSPVQTHRKSVATVGTGIADDDDDLDKQLALAMAEDDDVGVPPAPPAESDEESEEE